MPLDVEDGTGKPAADAYVSLVDAAAYFLARGVEAWADADDDTAREGAIRRATTAMDAKWRGRWLGQKRHATQRRAWPRSEKIGEDLPMTDADGAPIATNSVPLAIVDVCCEIALIELTERFLPERLSRDQMIKREKVDVIETEYVNNAPFLPQYPHIDQMLQGYCSTGGLTIGVTIGLTQREIDQGMVEDDYLRDPRYFLSG